MEFKTTDIQSAVKIITRNGYDAVIINDTYTVSTSSDQRYFVAKNVAKGVKTDSQDCSEFIKAFHEYEIKLDTEQKQIIIYKQEAERKRIADITERIKGWETPKELANEFGLSIVEIASHWSDLYEGRSTYGIIINGKKEAEIMEMAVTFHDIDGEYGEARHRNGEHHHTFSGGVYDLNDYQKGLKRHFNGDHYFFKSQETEQEFILEEIEKAAADRDMDKVKGLMQSFDEIEDGYYDCNGNLEILEKDLNSDNITGYSEDVYSYSFAYLFRHKHSFQEVIKEEDNDD